MVRPSTEYRDVLENKVKNSIRPEKSGFWMYFEVQNVGENRKSWRVRRNIEIFQNFPPISRLMRGLTMIRHNGQSYLFPFCCWLWRRRFQALTRGCIFSSKIVPWRIKVIDKRFLITDSALSGIPAENSRDSHCEVSILCVCLFQMQKISI